MERAVSRCNRSDIAACRAASLAAAAAAAPMLPACSLPCFNAPVCCSSCTECARKLSCMCKFVRMCASAGGSCSSSDAEEWMASKPTPKPKTCGQNRKLSQRQLQQPTIISLSNHAENDHIRTYYTNVLKKRLCSRYEVGLWSVSLFVVAR